MVAIAIGTAVVGAVGAGTSIIEGNKASKTAANTAAANNQIETDQYNKNAQALAPYEATGGPATLAISQLLGLDSSDPGATQAYKNWQASTGYQQQLKTGNQQVQAALGAKGLLDSGAGQKALLTYGQQAANSNFQTYYGDLTGQQDVGLTAASAQAGVGQGYANAVSANNNTAANASESASLNTGNQINSALSSGLSAYALNSALGSGYGGGGSYPAITADEWQDVG